MFEDDLEAFIQATRREIADLRATQRRWRIFGLLLVVVVLALPASSWATRKFNQLVVEDGAQSATLSPDGLSFAVDGSDRLRLESSPHWSGVTGYGEDGGVTWSVGTERGVTSFKLFSKSQDLRVEVTESLLGAGAGVRLYDRNGKPRATIWADRRGESGISLTDVDLQPRIELRAEPTGASLIRAVDSNAENVAELSVVRSSDVLSRYTGGFPVVEGADPLAPMLYLNDRSGARHVATPNPPF